MIFTIQSLPNHPIQLYPRRRVRVDIHRTQKECGIWTGWTSRNQVKNGHRRLQLFREIECQIVNLVLINFAISIQFVAGGALELALCLPGDPRNTPQVPPNQYDILRRLPNPKYVNSNFSEQNSAVKPKCPEDQFVILNAGELVQWVCKRDVIPANLIKIISYLRIEK